MTPTKLDPTDLTGLIRLALDDFATKVHTAIPGAIVSYTPATKQANVQPLIQRRFWKDGALTAQPLPVINAVPVQFPGTPRAQLSFDLQPGDTGMIQFSEAALDAWLKGAGGQVDPQDDRRFDINDAVFIPGVATFGAPGLPGVASGMLLQYGVGATAVSLKLGGAGTISMLAVASGNPMMSDATTDATFWAYMAIIAAQFGLSGSMTSLKAIFGIT
jgi:hypothetical protein